MREIALPTFEVGERVRIHNRLIEAKCPSCNEPEGIWETVTWDTMGATIMPWDGIRYCGCCNYKYTEQESEGWYSILDDEGEKGAVPYTLLERIEEVTDEPD